MKTKLRSTLTLLLGCALAAFCANAADAQKMKMTTDIPESITTPDSVETRIGTLKFFDGIPSKAYIAPPRHGLTRPGGRARLKK